VTVLLSHADDDATEVTWPQRDIDVSHTGDGAIVATWLQHDIDVESCWRRFF
jgi:hypothetical protein